MSVLCDSVSLAPFQSVMAKGVEHLLHYKREDGSWMTYNKRIVHECEAIRLPPTHEFDGELIDSPRYFIKLADGLMPLLNMPRASEYVGDTTGFVTVGDSDFIWDIKNQSVYRSNETYHLYVMTGRGHWL